MNIIEVSQNIIELYRKPNSNFSSKKDMKLVWNNVLEEFDRALEDENDINVLEKCILDDINWELHVEGRLKMLRKAKMLGAKSESFLKDYYGYLAAHLDPSCGKEAAERELERLFQL